MMTITMSTRDHATPVRETGTSPSLSQSRRELASRAGECA